MHKLSIVLLLCAVSLNSAWWEVGHMMVAQIAWNEMYRLNKTTLTRCEEIVQSLNSLADERSHDFI